MFGFPNQNVFLLLKKCCTCNKAVKVSFPSLKNGPPAVSEVMTQSGRIYLSRPFLFIALQLWPLMSPGIQSLPVEECTCQSLLLYIWVSCPHDHLQQCTVMSRCFSGMFCLLKWDCHWFWLTQLVVCHFSKVDSNNSFNKNDLSGHNTRSLEQTLLRQRIFLKCQHWWCFITQQVETGNG